MAERKQMATKREEENGGRRKKKGRKSQKQAPESKLPAFFTPTVLLFVLPGCVGGCEIQMALLKPTNNKALPPLR